jgi:hypothetical protein
MKYKMAQNAPNNSLDVVAPADQQPETIESGNGFFNFGCNSNLDFAEVPAQINVNDQASSNVDENLTFTATLTAAELRDAFKYKQSAPNVSGGEPDANNITLSISGGYDDFKTALFNQLKQSLTGDNGVSHATSLGDYVVNLVAWAVFGTRFAVAAIANDNELTDHVDGSQEAVADKVAKAIVTYGEGANDNLEDNGPHMFAPGDISSCPLGDVLTTMIKYHPDRFQVNDVSDFVSVPFEAGDVISFTVTFENLKVVENVGENAPYLKAVKDLPYNGEIDDEGYLNGGVHDHAEHKWVVGVKITLE